MDIIGIAVEDIKDDKWDEFLEEYLYNTSIDIEDGVVTLPLPLAQYYSKHLNSVE